MDAACGVIPVRDGRAATPSAVASGLAGPPGRQLEVEAQHAEPGSGSARVRHFALKNWLAARYIRRVAMDVRT